MLHQDELQSAEPAMDLAPPSLWQRIQGVFSGAARLRNLNWAVAEFPDVPANYVLRGELLLRQGDLFGAIADFRKGYELAAVRLETEDWGVVAQGLQDRALVGLRDALNRAARYNLGTIPDDQTN